MNAENAPVPATEKSPEQLPDLPIMKFFKYQHLPNHLKEVSAPFCELAETVNNYRKRTGAGEIAEIVACLRKLLEAKDCAVRAMLTSIR